MTMLDDIRRDREAGTPGPWCVHDCESYGERSLTFYQEVWNDVTDILVTTEVTRAHNDGGKANMRRIARVPQMEAALLAAEELAALLDKMMEQSAIHDPHYGPAIIALSNWRAAMEDTQ